MQSFHRAEAPASRQVTRLLDSLAQLVFVSVTASDDK